MSNSADETFLDILQVVQPKLATSSNYIHGVVLDGLNEFGRGLDVARRLRSTKLLPSRRPSDASINIFVQPLLLPPTISLDDLDCFSCVLAVGFAVGSLKGDQ